MRAAALLLAGLAACAAPSIAPPAILEVEVKSISHTFTAEGESVCAAEVAADEVTATISTTSPGECLRLGHVGSVVCIARDAGRAFRLVPCPVLPCRKCAEV